MQFLHKEFSSLGPDDVVEVSLDRQANVQLLDDINFSHYRNRRSFTYHGGLAKASPVHLSPPHFGRWHLVVDLGGYSGSVNISTRLI
jgi:hypothetical protein